MLLVDKNSIKKTHYEVLSVKQDASYDEIKARYRAAVLNSHPDKIHLAKPEEPSDFLDVQNAWEVLCDSVSRANYDSELRASKQESEALATEVSLGEMMVEMDGDFQGLLYECRCGDYFSVTSLELQEMGVCLDGNGVWKCSDSEATWILLPCGSCSLKIRLMLGVDC